MIYAATCHQSLSHVVFVIQEAGTVTVPSYLSP